MEEILKKQQNIIFSGDGASHQNGAEERATKTVVNILRAMLMHAALRFPEDTFSTDLWPMEIYYSVWIYNWIHNMKSGSSAIGIWSRSRFEPVADTLNNCHVWGCPKYVL